MRYRVVPNDFDVVKTTWVVEKDNLCTSRTSLKIAKSQFFQFYNRPQVEINRVLGNVPNSSTLGRNKFIAIFFKIFSI